MLCHYRDHYCNPCVIIKVYTCKTLNELILHVTIVSQLIVRYFSNLLMRNMSLKLFRLDLIVIRELVLPGQVRLDRVASLVYKTAAVTVAPVNYTAYFVSVATAAVCQYDYCCSSCSSWLLLLLPFVSSRIMMTANNTFVQSCVRHNYVSV